MMGNNPGGTGNSSKATVLPRACALIASSNCLQMRPYRRALDVLPSSSAATLVRR